MKKLKLKVSDTIYEKLNGYESFTAEQIAIMLIEKGLGDKVRGTGKKNQYNMNTKDGILEMAYQYQKKKVGDIDKDEFFRKWKSDDIFNAIFDDYVDSEYNKDMRPCWVFDRVHNVFVIARYDERSDIRSICETTK